MKKNKNKKLKKQRDYVALGMILRKGSGAGFHSKRGYSRKQKHKKDIREN